jgi:hypothetical protein
MVAGMALARSLAVHIEKEERREKLFDTYSRPILS